jgi:hypothetical protein
MARTTPVLRISVDLGSQTTRILGTPGRPGTPRVLPTVFARGSEPNTYLIGRQALASDQNWPLRRGVIEAEEDLLTFLRILRQFLNPAGSEIWAVLSAPSAGRTGEAEKLAQVASIAFERALVVPGLTLAAWAVKQNGAPLGDRATLLDLGAASLQIATYDARRPEPAEIFHLAAGGSLLDIQLARALTRRYPELSVDIGRARYLKERYGRCGEGPGVALVQVVHQGHRRIVDVGPTVFETVDPWGHAAAQAVAQVLGDPNGRTAREHGRTVALTGGGAQVPGIETEVRTNLQALGYPTERVIVPERPAEAVVRGGWHVAKLLTPSHWEVLA